MKQEKKNYKNQTMLLTQLSLKYKEQNSLLKFKEDEIKELEVKLMRYDALSARNGSMTTPGLPSGAVSEHSKEADTPQSLHPLTMPVDSVMITQRGQQIIEDRQSCFCPYTSNQKFELFIDDLLSLKLKPFQVKKNITDYVKAVETHYTDVIDSQKLKVEKTIKSCNKKLGQVALRVDERSELQDILIDALEKTKLQIFKRKLK